MEHADWVSLYEKLIRYDVQLDADEGVRQVLEDQYSEANRAFSKYVEDSYRRWISDVDSAPDTFRPAPFP